MNNLGRLRVERREFVRAVAILKEATTIMQAEQSENHDTLIFALSNLALAHAGLGQDAEARALFNRALSSASDTGHRLEGPIMTDLGDLYCRTGELASGMQRLDKARPIVQQRYPDEPWRIAYIDNVRAGCLLQLGRRTEAEVLIDQSTPVLLSKWPADSCFGHDALRRAARVYQAAGNDAKLVAIRRMVKVPR